MNRFFFLLIIIALPLTAKNFGVVGDVVPIREKNLIDLIKERAEVFSNNEKNQIQKQIKKRYEKKLKNPQAIDLPETLIYSTHTIDPSITVNADIKDTKGNVIAHKGKRYNPLKDHHLNRDLLFFDGDDVEQIEWAKSNKGSWILIKGHPLDLEESENIPVYFDQGGILCSKFKIRSVPSKISQNGNVLKVESIPKGARS